MRSFVVWLGGIAATVIGGLLIYYITKPAASPTFDGMVADGARNAPIKDAQIFFEFEPKPPGNGPCNGPCFDFTDDNGSYNTQITQLPSSVKVTLHAHAKGFRDSKPVSLVAIQTENRTDFVLEPLPSEPTPHPVATPAATPAVGHITLHYVPKAALKKIAFPGK